MVLPILLLITPELPASGSQQTISYVQSLQTKEGGFRIAPGNGPASLRATIPAIRALKYFGGKPKDPQAIQDFVQKCYDPRTGGFKDNPSAKPDVFTTAVGIMAMQEVSTKKDELALKKAIRYLTKNAKSFNDIRIAAAGLESAGISPAQAKEWLRYLQSLKNKSGTYGNGSGKARATGATTVAILRLKDSLGNEESLLKEMLNGQREDGAWGKEGTEGSDLESTYQVMRAIARLKAQPKDKKALLRFLAKCRKPNGSYSMTPNGKGNVVATYFAGIIHHWLD